MGVVVRGTFFLMLAQFVTSLSGYGVHIALARLMGPSIYGDFGLILSFFLIAKTIFATGVNRSVSKYVSEGKWNDVGILKSGLHLQFILTAICIALYYLFSGLLSGYFNDPSLTNNMFYSSFILIPLSAYVVITKGYLGGKRRFRTQALLEAFHSIMKLIIALLLVYFGYGILGALTGYALGPLLATIVAIYYIFRIRRNKSPLALNTKKLFLFSVPISLFYVFNTVNLEIPLFLLKHYWVDDALIGYYTSATTLARVSFTLASALVFTMIPSISSAFEAKNMPLVRKYIKKSFRYMFLVLAPFVILTITNSKSIIELLYSNVFQPASSVLPYLVLAFFIFSVVMVFASFFIAVGKPGTAMKISIVSLIFTVLISYTIIPMQGMIGAGISLLIGSIISLLISIVVIYRFFGRIIQQKSLRNILFSCVIIGIMSHYFSLNNVILGMALYLILYFGILFLIKEISSEDKKTLLSIFNKNANVVSKK